MKRFWQSIYLYNVKKAVKQLILVAVVGGVILTFSGCMSRAELNEKLIIEGIGIDSSDGEYVLAVMTLNTESTEELLPPEVLNVSGRSVSECFENISRDTGREVMLSDNRFIIMNKSAAEKADEVLSYFDNSFEARPDILLYVTEESSRKLLESDKVLDSMSAEDIAMISGEHSGGAVSSCRFREFKASDNSGIYDVSIPILKLSDDESRIIPDGSALFKNGKMSGAMTSEESVILNLLSDNADGAVITLSDENGESMPIEIISSKSENNLSLNDGKFIYSKDMNVTVSLPQYSNNNLKQNKKFLGKIEEFLERKCIQTAERAVKNYNSDILKIGKKAQNGFYSDFLKISNWHEVLRTVKFKFSVTSDLAEK